MAFITNKERQKILDAEKWEASARENCDLSGAMDYCKFCKAKNDTFCGASQNERVEFSLCAKAYNKISKNI